MPSSQTDAHCKWEPDAVAVVETRDWAVTPARKKDSAISTPPGEENAPRPSGHENMTATWTHCKIADSLSVRKGRIAHSLSVRKGSQENVCDIRRWTTSSFSLEKKSYEGKQTTDP